MTPSKNKRKQLPNIIEDEDHDGSSTTNSHLDLRQENVDDENVFEHFQSGGQQKHEGLFSRRHSDNILADVTINQRRLKRVESERVERDLHITKEKRAASDPQYVAEQIDIYNKQSNIPFRIHFHEKVIFFSKINDESDAQSL